MMVEVGYAEAATDLAQPKGGLLRPRIEHLEGAQRRSICLPRITSYRPKQDESGKRYLRMVYAGGCFRRAGMSDPPSLCQPTTEEPDN